MARSGLGADGLAALGELFDDLGEERGQWGRG
ncbi:hypothetical protein BJ969_003582 [Saccharopolyspora gloriosae]|uniref:Uncharacterized protein n=1 Tax=Saccharopolyspora gloriosae TaxID=455344 RepID=A0A840NFX9_9PSEU|nr:hypothetical protein [Saccharopolyspora gloriosae]